MTVQMCKARGWDPRDNNAADALGILDYAAFRFGPKPDWPVDYLSLEAAHG